MKKMISQICKLTIASALTLVVATSTFAQTYPNKPVKIIIPFPPGGTLDSVGRQLAQKLSTQLGQQFIVENRPGGNGIIGADVVAKAPADGYTLLFNASTFTTAPMTMKQVPYSVEKDFAPVALVAKAPLSVSINKNLPVTDIKSLIAYAKANPGKMTFAVGSVGSAGHLATELLKKNGGLDYTVIPYKGTAPAFQDLIGGQIDGFIDPILGSLQYHKGGLLRVIAVTSVKRAPNLPDVPTVGEAIPGYEFYSWYGLWSPTKVPNEVKELLNTQVNKALSTDMKETLIQQGLIVSGGRMDEFQKFQASDMSKSQKLIKDANIRLE